MSNRPLGISLLCGFFGLIGVGSLVSGMSVSTESLNVPAGEPASVHLFVYAYPFFALFLGLLGLFAAATLWIGSSMGRTSGLTWLGLWIAEEFVLGVWTAVGPEIVREVSSGLGENVVRIIVGMVMFYYLWTVGGRYVGDESADAS